ncbi:protein NKG7-like [Eublepharis macularius]|uniref:Protein NKG7-like n=1 Tax=Eublepharis macularius TaxID=481883 RepID=A0AA97LGJ9_EUBMA|nr:protein NKG7-like [Eublepharis macularius]
MGWHQLLAAGCTVFSLIMLIIVVTSHNWIVVESTSQMYYSGVWKICATVVCDSVYAKKGYFQLIRTLFVLAMFSTFFSSSFMLFTYRYLPAFRSSRFLFAAIGSFITGFLMLIAVTVYTIFIVKHGISPEVHVTYQWSFYLAWCIGPSFALTGFLSLMAYYFMPVHRISLTDDDSINQSPSSELRIISMESCHRNSVMLNMAEF